MLKACRLVVVLAAFLAVFVSFGVSAEERHVVVYNGLKFSPELKPHNAGIGVFSEYGIVEHAYHWASIQKTIEKRNQVYADWLKRYGNIYKPLNEKTFVEDLKKARMLYIGEFCMDGMNDIVASGLIMDAVKDFLSAGGTVYIDYTPTGTPAYDTFLNMLGTERFYESFGSGLRDVVPFKGTLSHPIFTKPHKVSSDRIFKCNGYWRKITSNCKTLLNGIAEPAESSMLLLEGIQGKGKIILCQVPFFREQGLIAENILSYIYGMDLLEERKHKVLEQGGPGELL